MTRAHSGIERLLYDSYEMILGGRAGSRGRRIQLKEWYLVPRRARRTASRRTACCGGLRPHHQPAPVVAAAARRVPYDVAFSNAAETFGWVTTLEQGIPGTDSRLPVGQVKVPAGVVVNSPNRPTSTAPPSSSGTWVSNSGCARHRRRRRVRRHGHRWGLRLLNVNYGEPGGGQTSRSTTRRPAPPPSTTGARVSRAATTACSLGVALRQNA